MKANPQPDNRQLHSFRTHAHPRCVVCSPANPMGLGVEFAVRPDGSVEGEFCGGEVYEGYPGLLHGGAAQASATASGSITTAIPILGAAASVTDAAGDLTTAIPLFGVAASVSNAIGSLDLAVNLSGDAIAQAAAAGTLTTQITLAGSAVSGTIAAGTLSGGAYTQPPVSRLARVRPETRVLAA